MGGLFICLFTYSALASPRLKAARSVTPKWVTNEPSGPGNWLEEKRKKHQYGKNKKKKKKQDTKFR